MENKFCPKCGAKWIDGQLYWATGKQGSEADLAGLVCDQYSDEQCINTLKGTKHNGQTWEKRRQEIDEVLAEHDRQRLERQLDL